MQGDKVCAKQEDRFTNKKNKRGWQKLKKRIQEPRWRQTRLSSATIIEFVTHGSNGDFNRVHARTAGHPNSFCSHLTFSLYASAHCVYTFKSVHCTLCFVHNPSLSAASHKFQPYLIPQRLMIILLLSYLLFDVYLLCPNRDASHV